MSELTPSELLSLKNEQSSASKYSSSVLIGWCLFDFANSLLIINGGLYFPQWLTIDNGLQDIWFNVGNVAISVFLLATAPLLGRVSDRSRSGPTFLVTTAALMFLATLAMGLIDMGLRPSLYRATLGVLLYCALMYCYNLSLVFYNDLLAVVAPRHSQPRISGFGLAAGWFGGVAGIFAVYPFVLGKVSCFGASGRGAAFFPSAILYAVFTVASFALLFGRKSGLRLTVPAFDSHDHLDSHLALIRNIFRHRVLCVFLITYFLFSDAILTIQNNASIYLERAMGMSDAEKAVQFVLLLTAAALGGLVSGFLIEKYGKRMTLRGVLGAWVLVLFMVASTSSFGLFTVLFGIIGFLYGAVWNVSRVTFSAIIPQSARGEYFGVYASFERAASLVGPLLWSIPLMIAPATSSSYRWAMVIMAVMLVSSFLFQLRTPPD